MARGGKTLVFTKSNFTSYLDLVLILQINWKFIKSLRLDNIVGPIPVVNALLSMDRYPYLGTLYYLIRCMHLHTYALYPVYTSHTSRFCLINIISKKRRFVEERVVSLTVTCNAIIHKNLPLKMQDPSNFTIPCTIGNFEFGKALCDLGARINFMPLSVVKRLSLGELTPINMTLQMTYMTMAQLEGVLEYVLIKVGKFIFLVDFLVMDMEEDTQVPLLIGRPFLAT